MTSNAAHTPGRLHFSQWEGAFFVIADDKHRVLFHGQNDIPTNKDEADFRRLVACWNAAHDASLSTEALESGVVKEMIEALKQISATEFRVGDKFPLEDAHTLHRQTQAIARTVLAKLADSPNQSQEERE